MWVLKAKFFSVLEARSPKEEGSETQSHCFSLPAPVCFLLKGDKRVM